MKKLLFAAIVFAFYACNNGDYPPPTDGNGTTKLIDTNKVVKDSTVIDSIK